MSEVNGKEDERSILYRQIIEKKRKQLGKTPTKSPEKQQSALAQTFATTADGHLVNLKFTAADQEISVISKASSKMEHLLEKTPEPGSKRYTPRKSHKSPLRFMEQMADEEDTPRLRALHMTPVANPIDDMHMTIENLTKTQGDTSSRRPKTSFLPEADKKTKLKKFDFERLSKSRQPSSTRASQLKVKREAASKSPTPREPFTVRDRLNNQLSFLTKTYGEHGDKSSISFTGLGKILCGLGVLKHLTPADLEINEFMVSKVKQDPVKAKEEARLQEELWNFLHYYCYEDTDLVPAPLVKAMLKVLMSHEPDQTGIKELRAAADNYLLSIGWQPNQIDEFNNYVDDEIETAKRLPLFKIFLKFDLLKKQKAVPTQITKVSFDSNIDKPGLYSQQLDRLKKALNVKEKPLSRSTLLFEGYEFTFLPDNSSKPVRSDRNGDFEGIIQRKSFAELHRETEHEHMKVAFEDPVKRAISVEKAADEREHEDKENFNYNLVA